MLMFLCLFLYNKVIQICINIQIFRHFFLKKIIKKNSLPIKEGCHRSIRVVALGHREGVLKQEYPFSCIGKYQDCQHYYDDAAKGWYL